RPLVGRQTGLEVLQPSAQGARGRTRLRHDDAVEEAAESREDRDPDRQGLQGPRQVPEPLRTGTDLLDRVRRGLPVHPAQTRGDRIGLVAGALWVLYARDPLRQL